MQKFTRLAQLCSIFGWKGGTIHQAQTEAQNVVEDASINVLNMSEDEFQVLCSDLRVLYPSYLRDRLDALEYA